MINVLIFSKDRGCQLELLIRSIKAHFYEWKMLNFKVLYTYSNEEYKKGYDKVMLIHSDFEYIKEIPGKFKEQVVKSINPHHQATMFFVDDQVFKDNFFLKSEPIVKFLSDKNILCVSLRLCPRINYCYTEKKDTPAPRMTKDLMWFWKGMPGDYGYPMALDSHLFKTEDILPLICRLEYENPNTFEGMLSLHPINKPYMICYPESKVMNIPANKVQTANGNHCGNIPAEFLNKEFLKNKRISRANLDAFMNTSCHQEVPLIMEDALKYNVDSILNIIKDRSVDYTAIAHADGFIADMDNSPADINFFVPKKGRDEFLKPFVAYVARAAKRSSRKIRVIVLENDDSPKSRFICKSLGVDYVFVPLSLTNSKGLIAKALMYNLGYLITPKAIWNIFHDLDILIDDDYFIKLESYLSKKPNWIQPYTQKRVLRLSGEITKTICSGNIPDLSSLAPLHAVPSNPGSPGGSIVISSEIFEKIGGYDPELFYGYAPEDTFLWIKLECLFKTLGHVTTCFHGSASYADNPSIEVYHLEHESLETLNNDRLKMRQILESFFVFDYEAKKTIIDFKKELFAKQIVVR